MEGFQHRPLDIVSSEKEKVQKKTETEANIAESPRGVAHPNGYTSVEIMGEDKFNRLQELGASLAAELAAGKDVSNEDREEYRNLSNEFRAALDSPNYMFNVIAEREKNSQSSISAGRTENTDVAELPSTIAFEEEKFERLQTLKRMKDLFDGHLRAADEKEYDALTVEWHAAYHEYLRREANTAPSSITFESPVEIYSESDVLKWEGGAHKFKEFSELIQEMSMQERFEAIFNPIDANALKAVFLKEKPAIFLWSPIDSYDPNNALIIKLMESFGLRIVGRYIYDKEQVKNVIEHNESIFRAYGSHNPDEVMRILANAPVGANHSVMGVLLGFPLESVKKFEKHMDEQASGIKTPEPQFVNVYGIMWLDFNDSMESKMRQARLKAAFELSGVLNT
jgi:hypothetical protein